MQDPTTLPTAAPEPEAERPLTHLEQHVTWLCDADKRATAPSIRRLGDIATARHFIDAYASQRVTP